MRACALGLRFSWLSPRPEHYQVRRQPSPPVFLPRTHHARTCTRPRAHTYTHICAHTHACTHVAHLSTYDNKLCTERFNSHTHTHTYTHVRTYTHAHMLHTYLGMITTHVQSGSTRVKRRRMIYASGFAVRARPTRPSPRKVGVCACGCTTHGAGMGVCDVEKQIVHKHRRVLMPAHDSSYARCVRIRAYTRIHTRARTPTHSHKHARARTHTHPPRHSHTHTHTHTHTHRSREHT